MKSILTRVSVHRGCKLISRVQLSTLHEEGRVDVQSRSTDYLVPGSVQVLTLDLHMHPRSSHGSQATGSNAADVGVLDSAFSRVGTTTTTTSVPIGRINILQLSSLLGQVLPPGGDTCFVLCLLISP
jgi:hypothetical protein